MSAPTTHDPLVVNTQDGVVWQRRAVTSDGRGLYAVTGSCSCPEYLMATLAELAEHGICGSADVLPVPVGPAPQLSELGQVSAEIARFGIYGAAVPAAKALVKRADELVTENASLRARIAALLVERHSTNESLDEAAQALRADRDRVAELERTIAEAPASYALMERARVEADGITRRLAPSQVLREDEPAVKCRCGEPGVDPYACEAEDCTHEFSELNPFGGGSGPVEGHDAKVSRACGCGFRTTVWHVADGSAEAELHEHVVRVHGGVYLAESGGAS